MVNCAGCQRRPVGCHFINFQERSPRACHYSGRKRSISTHYVEFYDQFPGKSHFISWVVHGFLTAEVTATKGTSDEHPLDKVVTKADFRCSAQHTEPTGRVKERAKPILLQLSKMSFETHITLSHTTQLIKIIKSTEEQEKVSHFVRRKDVS